MSCVKRIACVASIAIVASSWSGCASSPSTVAASSASSGNSSSPSSERGDDRIELRVDTQEAELALELAARSGRSESISAADWDRLFATDGYRRLANREQQMGRAIVPAEFEAFLVSPAIVKQESALRATLEQWKKADLDAAAKGVLDYLPADAKIRATVFPVIKPQSNSFVFEPAKNPAIFLYLDPALTREKFENTVAHELHHIGFASLPSDATKHEPKVQTVLDWMGAFGEGFAMLAAAGGPDVHPHARSSAAERERWDRDVANFDGDLKKVERFFLDVLDGRLAASDEISKVAYSFFGVQGPWYTVGWKMSVVVEKRYGRAVLIEGMHHPDRLLATYNRAAKEANGHGGETLALWSDELLERIGATALVD